MTVVRVWDLPLRLFHWGLVLAVLAMVATVSLGWMEWHMRCGYVVLTLLMFRLLWGFCGGYWSRFSSFVPGPRLLVQYLQGKTPASAFAGHNPLGALSVLAMLLALGLQVASGLGADDEIATEGPLAAHLSAAWVNLATHYHTKIGKYLVLLLVVLHVGAIVRYRRLGQDLVTPMVTGDKSLVASTPSSLDSPAMRLRAALCLMGCVAMVVMLLRSLG
ncbi:cytochrome b/b6 domain-containing protein [Curvibacter sp. APW13]|uniref:cytochrome b/b6 domain-containing protein n=1 Tax=Curvibacter sp. APW13 TaxID=3077236 RepID=UPI0028DF9AC8|nr:cytochrome b/b6 domain-containing protein [Curvibacter sp. APW13]MDT8990624.1 cytochrome b/b6 domain-containing protein [Curvibacter sp. APW13]